MLDVPKLLEQTESVVISEKYKCIEHNDIQFTLHDPNFPISRQLRMLVIMVIISFDEVSMWWVVFIMLWFHIEVSFRWLAGVRTMSSDFPEHITIFVGKHGKSDYSRNTLLKIASHWHLGVCQGQEVDEIEQNSGQNRELINHWSPCMKTDVIPSSIPRLMDMCEGSQSLKNQATITITSHAWNDCHTF